MQDIQLVIFVAFSFHCFMLHISKRTTQGRGQVCERGQPIAHRVRVRAVRRAGGRRCCCVLCC